jgi:hypothetical protein
MQALIDAEKPSKKCNICSEVKPISEYYPNKQCKLGVVGTCKVCYKIRISNWYSENRSERQRAANSRNQERKEIAVKHFGGVCHDCNESYPNCVFQFHHLDPAGKDVNPSYAISSSPAKMWEELSKCIMLCANCHLIRHHRKEGVDATTH